MLFIRRRKKREVTLITGVSPPSEGQETPEKPSRPPRKFELDAQNSINNYIDISKGKGFCILCSLKKISFIWENKVMPSLIVLCYMSWCKMSWETDIRNLILVCPNSLKTMITPYWGCTVCVLMSHIVGQIQALQHRLLTCLDLPYHCDVNTDCWHAWICPTIVMSIQTVGMPGSALPLWCQCWLLTCLDLFYHCDVNTDCWHAWICPIKLCSLSRK